MSHPYPPSLALTAFQVEASLLFKLCKSTTGPSDETTVRKVMEIKTKLLVWFFVAKLSGGDVNGIEGTGRIFGGFAAVDLEGAS
jgi:hypothetical protein